MGVVIETANYFPDSDYLNPSDIRNSSGRSCTLANQTEEGYNFSCEVYNPIFAMLTLAFIFLPSLNVVGALYGPKTAGLHAFVWGTVMATVSGIWLFCALYKVYGSVITMIIPLER